MATLAATARGPQLFQRSLAPCFYSAVVSSQFDADRLDYIQRDRLMAGVEYGHIDPDWLIDCLEVGPVIVGRS
jgi:HD superfamily phosphohydrolase